MNGFINTHRLLEFISSTAHVTQTAVKALIASESSEESVVQKVTFNLKEVYPNSRSAPSRLAIVLLPRESCSCVFRSTAWKIKP